MKTITRNTNNFSMYIFEDDVPITVKATSIITPNFIIGDLNSGNSTMHENVTPPDDWANCKYIFDGTTWSANPNWTEPREGNIE
jgi:hypothetical protein